MMTEHSQVMSPASMLLSQSSAPTFGGPQLMAAPALAVAAPPPAPLPIAAAASPHPAYAALSPRKAAGVLPPSTPGVRQFAPAEAMAEIAKLKARVGELKKEMDEARAAASKEQAWLLSQAKSAKADAERAVQVAAESVRAAKEGAAKEGNEHARAVNSLIAGSNAIASTQDRIASRVPTSLVPYLVGLAAVGKDADLERETSSATREAAMGALGLLVDAGVSGRPSRPRSASTIRASSTPRGGTHAVDPTTLHLVSAPSMDDLRTAYAEAVARLNAGHAATLASLTKSHE